MPKFTDREIEIFRTVLLTGSISTAGKRLNLSQPSVSRILGDFERKFGCELFVRRSRGVTPTHEAKVFFEEVERRIGVMASLEEIAIQIANKDHGALLLGANVALSVSLIPPVLEQMKLDDRAVAVKVHTRSSIRIIELVRGGLIDVGLVHSEPPPDGVRILKEFIIPYFVLLPRNHELAGQPGGIRLDDLATQKLVAPSEEIAEILNVRGTATPARTSIMADTFLSSIATADAIGGIPLVDGFMARHHVRKGDYAARPILDLDGLHDHIIEPISPQRSLIANDFQTLLSDEIEDVLVWARGFGARP